MQRRNELMTGFDLLVARFSRVVPKRVLRHLYVNDDSVRRACLTGAVKTMRDATILKKIKRLELCNPAVDCDTSTFVDLAVISDSECDKQSIECDDVEDSSSDSCSEEESEDSDCEKTPQRDLKCDQHLLGNVYQKRHVPFERGALKFPRCVRNKRNSIYFSKAIDGRSSNCSVKESKNKKLLKKIRQTQRDNDRLKRKLRVMRRTFLDRYTKRSTNTFSTDLALKRIERRVEEVQAATKSLLDQEESVPVEQMLSLRVPGNASPRHFVAELQECVSKLNDAYAAALEECSDTLRLLQEKSRLFDKQVSMATNFTENRQSTLNFNMKTNAAFPTNGASSCNITERKAPWEIAAPSTACIKRNVFNGISNRSNVSLFKSSGQFAGVNSNEIEAMADELKSITSDLFLNLLVSIDRSYNSSSIKNRCVEIRRGYRGGCVQKTTVLLDDVQIYFDEAPDWTTVRDGFVELVNVKFTPRRNTSVAAGQEPFGAWSMNPIIDESSNSFQGSLKLSYAGSCVYRIATDSNWKSPVPIHYDKTLGPVGRSHAMDLENRLLFLFRFALHSYTHIMASIHPDIMDPYYQHRSNTFYEQIRCFYEPRGVLRQ